MRLLIRCKGHLLAPLKRGLAISSRPMVIKNKAIKIATNITIGKPHHHHIPRRIADERKALLMVIPKVGMRVGPKPRISKPVAAKIEPDTAPVKVAAR